MIQSKELSRLDVLTNLPIIDVQWVPEKWTFMRDPQFEIFFDLMRPQWPPSERVPYISEKRDF